MVSASVIDSGNPLVLPILGVAGAMIGSFLNVVIHRLPIMIERDIDPAIIDPGGAYLTAGRYDLAFPGSACPACGHPIRPLENLPLISFFLLRGRCAACATPISWRYPVVEALGAAMPLLLAIRFGVGPALLAASVFGWFAIAIVAIDLRHRLIPDALSLPLLWCGLLINTKGIFVNCADAVIGAAAGYLAFWALGYVGRLAFGREALGQGDVKLMAAIGGWFGWAKLPAVCLSAGLTGTAICLLLMIVGWIDKKATIPFAPFLICGAMVVMVEGGATVSQTLGRLLAIPGLP